MTVKCCYCYSPCLQDQAADDCWNESYNQADTTYSRASNLAGPSKPLSVSDPSQDDFRRSTRISKYSK